MYVFIQLHLLLYMTMLNCLRPCDGIASATRTDGDSVKLLAMHQKSSRNALKCVVSLLILIRSHKICPRPILIAQNARTFLPSMSPPRSAFRFPSTESGVLGIGMPAPLLYSSKQVA
jgi:hypothetical protein